MFKLPKPLLWSTDGACVMAGVAHFMGWWQTNAGTVVTTLGGLWVLMQMAFAIYDRFFKKGKK